MCGLCGWVSPELSHKLSRDHLKSMTSTLRHRGPDDEGYFYSEDAAIAHRRLSIIDLATGTQPMSDTRGKTIAFNGEIYNYIEIRHILQKLGRTFKTQSDTEVLLEAYDEWGISFLDRLVGMFSFVIWDSQKREVLAVRDRLGKKPFYYIHDELGFAFASEIKALLTLPHVRKKAEMNPLALSDFLSLGYILTPKTIFKNIERLPAAHYAVYSLQKRNLTLRPYWKLETYYKPASKILFHERDQDELCGLLKEAVAIRLRSDVPLGAFLSSGIDSAAISAVMKKELKSPVRTFCVSFKEKSFDEAPEALATAQHLGLDFERIESDYPDDREVAEMMWFFDEPFADNSLIPTFRLNQEAKKRVTVVLSGDGGDEIFAGYPTAKADHYYRIYRKFPGLIQSGFLFLAKTFLRPSYRKLSLDYRILRFLKSKGLSREEAHYSWREIFSENEKSKILHPEIRHQCRYYRPFDVFQSYFSAVKNASFFDQTLFVDQKTWLQDDILVKVDRMSMAHAVEVRSPFLDHRLVEFTARMPQRAKFDGSHQKIALRNLLKSYLPDSVINRPKKGFSYPASRLAGPQLQSSGIPGILNPDFKLNSQGEDTTYQSFSLKILLIWLKMLASYQQTGGWRSVLNHK